MVCQAASTCQGVYNKTKISLSSIIIDTNTLWPEATQQRYCGSTTRPRRYGKYGGKDSKYKKAHKEATAAYCKKHPKKKR